MGRKITRNVGVKVPSRSQCEACSIYKNLLTGLFIRNGGLNGIINETSKHNSMSKLTHKPPTVGLHTQKTLLKVSELIFLII